MKIKVKNLLRASVLLSTIYTSLTCFAQGTAFTYQGRLNNGANAANGSYDFRFRLSSDSLGNNYVGSPVLTNAVGISNGLFTVVLDFGANFPGANRWLEVDVRTNGAASYTMLNPLQALLPTPYSIYAESAAVSSSVSSSAVTASSLNTLAAPASGQVLSYTGSGLSWITPSANSGLTLPYSGGVSSSSSSFTLTNSGTGPVLNLSDGSEDTLLDGNSITFTRTTGPGYIQANNRIDFETGGSSGGDGGANLILYPGQISSFNGKVGIGTSPISTLDVAGTFNVQDGFGEFFDVYSNEVVLIDSTDDGVAFSQGMVQIYDYSDDGLVMHGGDVSLNGGNNQIHLEPTGRVDIYTKANYSSGVYIAAGGSGWNSVSDRNMKENFVPTNPQAVLDRLAAIPISTWNYKTQDKSIRHLGPMAQDFHAAFAVGEDDKHINNLDEEGVALAAIQGLNQKVNEKDAEIQDLKARLEKLEELVNAKTEK